MASASVVGQNPGPQHRLDSEPPLLFLKFVNVRKKMPRKTSLEKIMLRKYSGTVETSSAKSEGGRGFDAASLKLSIHHSDSPALAGETACSSASPSDGCAAPRADAPRSVDGDIGERTDCDSDGPESRTTPAGRESQRGQSNDRSQNMCDCFLNQNTRGEKRNSHKRTAEITVMPGALAANGHTGAHSDVLHGKRASPGSGISSSSNNNGVSMGSPDGEAGGRLPVERLTQGRTGVVRFARPEPQRREAWTIFTPETQGDPRVKAERGEGHRFDSRTVTQDWCDVCNCQISARAALKCQKTGGGVSGAGVAGGARERQGAGGVRGGGGGGGGPEGAGGGGVAEREARGPLVRSGAPVAEWLRWDGGGGGHWGGWRWGSPQRDKGCRTTERRASEGVYAHRTLPSPGWWHRALWPEQIGPLTAGHGIAEAGERGDGPGEEAGLPGAVPSILHQVSVCLEEVRGDPEGEDGAVGGACFGQVSRRLGRLLKRLPKSRSWGDGLRMLRRTSSNGSLITASGTEGRTPEVGERGRGGEEDP
ncbi:unnamed protein product [Boreogadus saida]